MFGLGHLWDPGFYNTKTGAVFYDANGSDGGAAVQFASLTGVPALTYQDFVLFQLIFETPEPVKLAQAVDGERLVSSAFLIFGGADDSW